MKNIRIYKAVALVMGLLLFHGSMQVSYAGQLQDAIDAAVDYDSGVKYRYNADLHLYAVYKVNVHYIHFDANGGIAPPETQPVFADDYKALRSAGVHPVLPLEKPSKSGLTFLGWALDEDAAAPTWKAGDPFVGSTPQVAMFYDFSREHAETTLYAVWG